MKLIDGYTMMHEHVRIDLSSVKGDKDTDMDCKQETIDEFKELYKLGVRNILEVTNEGMGRDVRYVEEVAKESGINILQCTGFYKEPFLPQIVYDMDVEELSEWLLNEINNGLDGTDIKPVCIGEFGTSKDVMTEMEKKVFDACILAAKQSNLMLSTHTTIGTYGLEQAHYLIGEGIDPNRIVIGHMDLSGDLNIIREVIKTGVTVGFDTIGKNNYFPDDTKADFLIELEKEGLCDHIILSMDITRKSNFSAKGGIGYTYLFNEFLPLLRSKGMKEETINQMLVENPKRLINR